ncbi:MAG: hypothetical protein FIB01_16125 [Gemmatimonadetes bacterium]|nr:hypothetical protein [Gemmatimonadota bacterium]
MHPAVRAALTIGTTAALAAGAAPARAQAAAEPRGQVPWSHMHTLLQKTLFRVDVLELDICFDTATAGGFATLAARGPLAGAAADAAVRAALDGAHAFARIEFVRDVSLDQFLGGGRDELANAGAKGLLPDSVYRVIRAGLPDWYGFAERRGIRKGDRLFYDMRPEEVRTLFVGREGGKLRDHVSTGRARRNSPLASWLAPGSDFRKSLLQSLSGAGRGAAAAGRCEARGL